MKKLLFLLELLIVGSQTLFAGTVSFDQLSVSSDLTVSVYNNNLDKIYSEFNSSIESSNIAADTLAEVDFADDSNPRIRTAEGASCEFVYTGLLTTTTSGTLSGSVPAGTAYPLGYRIRKDSSTAKTFTGDCSPSATGCWTFVDLDINGNFTYSEVAIDAATPSVTTNSIRLSRVSTDGTQVAAVSDLRVTTCTTGAFSDISSTSGATTNLDEVLRFGKNRVSADAGWVQGLRVSWDGLGTTFTVKSGTAYINGVYRVNSADVSVPQTNDDPAAGTSGLDTSSIGASTNYTIYAVADRDSVDTMSFSYSTSPASPTGVTNYRKIGQIKTDASSSFVSQDMLTYHTVNPFEIAAAGVKFDGSSAAVASSAGAQFNISALADGGTGTYTITWDNDFKSSNYIVVCGANRTAAAQDKVNHCQSNTETSASTSIRVADTADSASDGAEVHVLAFGDKRE